MAHINLSGMGVALITPFQSNGNVDYKALARLTDNLLQNGADYLVVLGTTGEPPTLSAEEQKAIVETVVSQVNRQVPLILGAGGNCTQSLVHKLQTADFTGIDAILSVVPYYNKPTQKGLYQHYKHIAAATQLPVILYNVPARTGANLSAETTLRLAGECANIIAIKEASGNREQIQQIIQNKPADFQVISGDDSLALELIADGAAGVISVIGNVLPQAFSRMVHLALSGDSVSAQAIRGHFNELLELLFTDGNPAGVKSMLHFLGSIENELRLPLTPVEPATSEKIRKALVTFKNFL
jgi:4-hydroxy-tetrahydrodipicolinate synthase